MSKPRSPYQPGDRIHAMVPGPALSCGVVVSTEYNGGKWIVTADMGDDGHRTYRSVRNDGSSDFTNRPKDSLTKWCGKCFSPEEVRAADHGHQENGYCRRYGWECTGFPLNA